MDPVILLTFGVVAVISVVCYIIFNAATRDTNFDEGYNKSKLIVEDKNAKTRPKNVKPKKTGKVERNRTQDKPQETSPSKPVVEPEPKIEESSPKPESKKTESPPSNKTNEASKTAAAKKNKKVRKGESSNSTSESTPAPDETRDSPSKQAESVKKLIVPAEGTPKAHGKKDGSDSGSSSIINMETFIKRLSSSEDVDPECLSFICQYAEQIKQTESKHSEALSKLQQENSSKNSEISRLRDQLHDQVYNTQLATGKLQSLEQALHEEKEKFKLFASSVNPKLSENYQLHEKVRRLEEMLNAHNQNQAGVEKFKRENEQLVSQLRHSLAQANNQIQQKDIQIKQTEHEMKKRSGVFEEREAKFGEKANLIEELNEAIKQKDRRIEILTEESSNKTNAIEKMAKDFQAKEHRIVQEKDEQIKAANGKLEAELKESLDRIEELRTKNYKLVDSINALYSRKTHANLDEGNKKSSSQEVVA